MKKETKRIVKRIPLVAQGTRCAGCPYPAELRLRRYALCPVCYRDGLGRTQAELVEMFGPEPDKPAPKPRKDPKLKVKPLGLLTIQEAAQRLGIATETAQDWAKRGRLPAQKLGGRWVVEARVLDHPSLRKGAPGRPQGIKINYYPGLCPVCNRIVRGSRDRWGDLILRKHRDLAGLPCQGRIGGKIPMTRIAAARNKPEGEGE